jgi:membrane dipeptidase
MEHVLDHIEHIATVAGIEHVGLGTDVDLDGRDYPGGRKQDLDGVRYSQKILEVAEGLIRRNFPDDHIELCLGGNFRRALSEIWA